MIIYTNENNPATLKLIAAAKLASKHVEVKIVESNDRTISPPKHIPYIEIDAEETIFDPNAAVWYLIPTAGPLESLINEWLEWEATILVPSLALNTTAGKNEKVKAQIAASLKKLDKVLEKQAFLTGTEFNASDLVVWASLHPILKEENVSKELAKDVPNVTGWARRLEQVPQIKESLETYQITPSLAYASLLSGAKHVPILPSTPESIQSSPQHQTETITKEELASASSAWLKSLKKPPKLAAIPPEVLPEKGKRNILITSALPYVNNVPHLGNIIGCVLSADVFARFSRICNHNTLYIGGTDEYGTATETKALEEGLSCQAICDKYHVIHRDIYKWFNISFNHFGRTSTPEQTVMCQKVFLDLNDNGFVFTEPVEQLHCAACDRYLADRFVEGGCPHPGCGYEDARGDQCDGCGKLVNANELKNPRCKICSNAPKARTSAQFFIDLPKVEPLLHHWMKLSAPGWSSNAQVIARTWIREGLKPRCITRDLKWGVSVPLKGYTDKVFYVWYDAPIGYLSISNAYTKKWEEWWRPKSEVKVTLYQFMAKDNVPFHAVMFPACMLGVNKGYTVVSHIMATEYLNYEDGKFSKSRGIGVFGNDAQDTGIPSDVWRFYLLYVRPETQDSSFSWADLATKNNSELLNNLGNFINRALVFAKNNFDQTVPEMHPNKEDFTLLALCTRELKNYVACLEKSKLRDGIRHILSISRHGNQYMQSNQPWVLLKGTPDEKKRAGTVIGICCNLACLLATLLHPYMPETTETLNKQLNITTFTITPENLDIVCLLEPGHKLGEPSPLFAKLDPAHVEELKKKFGGRQNSPEKMNGAPNGLEALKEAIVKQGDKVRVLKSSGGDKKIWQPEVAILLGLKKQLEQAEKEVKVVKKEPVVENGGNVKDLEEEINKQGLVVRKLKESGAAKADWQPEVEKLLALKSKLAALNGGQVDAKNKKKKK